MPLTCAFSGRVHIRAVGEPGIHEPDDTGFNSRTVCWWLWGATYRFPPGEAACSFFFNIQHIHSDPLQRSCCLEWTTWSSSREFINPWWLQNYLGLVWTTKQMQISQIKARSNFFVGVAHSGGSGCCVESPLFPGSIPIRRDVLVLI